MSNPFSGLSRRPAGRSGDRTGGSKEASGPPKFLDYSLLTRFFFHLAFKYGLQPFQKAVSNTEINNLGLLQLFLAIS